jgi:DNA primase
MEDAGPNKKYSGIKGRNETYLYPAWMLDLAFDTLVVCEGELDAVRLWQEGIPACSPTNGAESLAHIPELITPYTHVKRLLIASDQDEAGDRGAAKLFEKGGHLYKCKRIKWDKTKGKDVTELLYDNKKESKRFS